MAPTAPSALQNSRPARSSAAPSKPHSRSPTGTASSTGAPWG